MIRAADFSSGSVRGRRGFPTLKPIWLRAYLTGIGLETTNRALTRGRRWRCISVALSVLPLRSPKLNSAVERAHRTHTEEFYEVTESSFDIAELREELLEWEQVYNTVRPHQALGYVTPFRFLEQRINYKRKEDVSLIIWTRTNDLHNAYSLLLSIITTIYGECRLVV